MKKLFLFVACLGITAAQAQHSEMSKQDKEFAEWALMANLMETKAGELGQRKGYSAEVKELGQRMIDDHKKADELLKQITSGKSVAVPTTLSESMQKDLDKLSEKEGEAFDKSFTDFMVSEHKKSIDLYEKETKKGENTELRAFATNALPSLNNHKNMGEATCKKLKK